MTILLQPVCVQGQVLSTGLVEGQVRGLELWINILKICENHIQWDRTEASADSVICIPAASLGIDFTKQNKVFAHDYPGGVLVSQVDLYVGHVVQLKVRV